MCKANADKIHPFEIVQQSTDFFLVEGNDSPFRLLHLLYFCRRIAFDITFMKAITEKSLNHFQ